MSNKLLNRTGLTLGVLLIALVSSSISAQIPQRRPLGLNPPTGLPIFPIMEGWYANEDGSYTISFGYQNRNTAEALDIPIGPNNYIEPALFNGGQPTYFETGRQTGVFTVTVPANMRDTDVWWHIKTGDNEILKVPGRSSSGAYELDYRPRPAGTVAPQVWFEGGREGFGPTGIYAENTLTVPAGSPLALTVHARDPSIRDRTDPRYVKPIPIRLVWSKYSGPGAVEFTRHESSPDLTEVLNARGRPMPADGAEQVTLVESFGTASVYGTFAEAGDYIIRTRVDNWAAADSNAGDQCCWTNVYQRVTVTP